MSVETAYVSSGIISWRDAVYEWGRQWVAMVDEQDLHPSMYPGWIEAAARAHGRVDDLRVLVAYDQNQLQGVVPYFRHRRRIMGIGLDTVELAGNLVSYHQDLACSGGHLEILELFLSQDELSGVDLLVAEEVETAGATKVALTELAKRRGYRLVSHPGDHSPYLTIVGEWEAMLGNMSRNFRYRVRRREKLLRDAGEVQMFWYEGRGVNSDHILGSILEIEENSWKVEAGMAISENLYERVYYKHLLPFLIDNDILLANILHLDGRPVAYSLCYQSKGKVGQLKTSYDVSFEKLAPGMYVNEMLIKRLFDKKYREFDFLGDRMRHKMQWTTKVRAHDACLLFTSNLPGRIAGTLKSIAMNFGRNGATA